MEVQEENIEVEHKQSVKQTIKAGDYVLLRLPTEEIKCIKLDAGSSISLGKFGTFSANQLIGQIHGLGYEIVDKKLKMLPPKSMEELEDTEATNELIYDGAAIQPLTTEDIEALKHRGTHVSDIIKKQIEQHANYSLKTEYSKDKYKKRKEAKYSKTFTVIEPTLFNVCQYWFTKDPPRIRDMRPDTFAQLMSISNVHPGARVLVVDDVSGLIVAGVLEHLGGEGRLLAITDIDGPPAFHIVRNMNFDPSVVTPVLASLNWAAVDEDYTPILPPQSPPGGKFRSDREVAKMAKRKESTASLESTREELLSGEWDALIIASQYEPYSIVEKLTPYLAGSASIVIYSPHLQVVAEAQNKMKMKTDYLAPSITETWLRQYQVLPGRTHPFMAMPGSGGYLLQSIRVFVEQPVSRSIPAHGHVFSRRLDDPNASSVRADRGAQRRKMREGKKRKRELEESLHASRVRMSDEKSSSNVSDAGLNGDVDMASASTLSLVEQTDPSANGDVSR